MTKVWRGRVGVEKGKKNTVAMLVVVVVVVVVMAAVVVVVVVMMIMMITMMMMKFAIPQTALRHLRYQTQEESSSQNHFLCNKWGLWL